MRRMLSVVFIALGLLAATAGTAHAAKSCPSGSRFVGNSAGGVCLGIGTGDLIKTIRN